MDYFDVSSISGVTECSRSFLRVLNEDTKHTSKQYTVLYSKMSPPYHHHAATYVGFEVGGAGLGVCKASHAKVMACPLNVSSLHVY